jgi:archaellum component FlaG (FlaF/FlaG flagellin family)
MLADGAIKHVSYLDQEDVGDKIRLIPGELIPKITIEWVDANEAV